MFGLAQKVEDKSVDFMRKHPKFTKGFIAGSTALATIGSTAVVASAEGEEVTSSGNGDMVDTVVDSMSTNLTGTLGKVIPAAIGIGVAVLGVTLAWKWMKKFIKGN